VTRTEMVERHLRARGIADERVLDAMGRVPREAFLPPELADLAYEDQPLPIAAGQTISQPYIVALMTEALRLGAGDAVLEIERHPELADAARRALASLGYHNVEVRCADGTLGWPEHAPYQAIAVTAGGPDLPRALLEQLAIGGRLVMPVGSPRLQELVRVTRITDDQFRREDLGQVMFVPLVGAQGWAEPPDAAVPVRRSVWPRRNPGPLHRRH
jgi:protein-L-isoaspartate(D-aspartate) O-methyltransferase